MLLNYLVLFSEKPHYFGIMSIITIESGYYERISFGVTSTHQQPVKFMFLLLLVAAILCH